MSNNTESDNGTELLDYVLLGPVSQGALLVLYSATTLSSVIGNVLVIVVFSVGRRSKTDITGMGDNKRCKTGITGM